MAEIKIEKKRPVWPWILLVLIILGILAYVFWYSAESEEEFEQSDDIEELNDDERTMHNNRDNNLSSPRTYRVIS